MNKKDRHMIMSNIGKLAKEIDFNSNLVIQMINKNIFTQQMIDDIQKISEEMDRKERFLFDLCRRGPDAYDQFVEVLYGTGQESAAKILRPDYFASAKNDEEIVANITSSPDVPPEHPLGSQDTGDNQPSFGTISSIENEDYMINVKKCIRGFSGRNIYQMASTPRGFTLIFNIHKFSNDLYPERKGSQAEANRLRDVFTQLHFDVKLFDNLSQIEMSKTIEEYRRSPELHKHDCLIVIVLSHGYSGYCVGSDGLALPFENIIQMFNNENCLQLVGRPKLFFFSCCRGDYRDTGPKYRFEEGEDAVSDAKSFSLNIVPMANDMMICYSTVDGYVSWRNEENGSWFGTALAQALMKYAHKQDLHYILTIASAMVTNKTTQNGEKQVMEHTFRGFTKLFYFNPGIPPIPVPSTLQNTE